ncbi:RPM1-interacting protein 4-like isoform X2 [Rhodamnia argentea]|uniref:RPM1-interacting protein 4-like isoform X2 n=1 Tax=Rhodamnia argentea TaxID=178133 RepID=A0A8B8R0W3_9MYRT|nr:RPM1-interacting protein 4-like isoform X2 [Rhodamnia argentea]
MPGPVGDVERIFRSVQAVSSTKRQVGQVSAGAHRRSHSDQPKAGYAHGLSSTMQRGGRYSRERNASDPCDHPKRSRAPKHGDLSNVRIRHAASSGSAYRDKTSTKTNPNDPEENPGAFSWRTGGTCGFFRSSSTKWSSSQKQHGTGSARSHRRSLSDELKRKSFGAKKGFSPSLQRSSGSSGQRNRDQPVDYSHLGATPVPVFSDWDETDPNSGEGYTERFDRIKEEKESASSNSQLVLSIPTSYSDSPTKERFLPYLFKTYCCVFSGNSCSRDSARHPQADKPRS